MKLTRANFNKESFWDNIKQKSNEYVFGYSASFFPDEIIKTARKHGVKVKYKNGFFMQKIGLVDNKKARMGNKTEKNRSRI